MWMTIKRLTTTQLHLLNNNTRQQSIAERKQLTLCLIQVNKHNIRWEDKQEENLVFSW